MSDEDGIDFLESSVEADGVVLHDAPFGLEEEEVVEVDGGVRVPWMPPSKSYAWPRTVNP